MKTMFLSALSLLMFDRVVAMDNSFIADANVITIAMPADNEKTPVKVEELPEGIRKTLATDAYKGWTATEAFLVKGEKASYYEITLKKEAEVKNVKLNNEGTIVE